MKQLIRHGEEPPHILLRDQAALGLASRAGGVDDVRQVRRARVRCGIGVALVREILLVEADHLRRRTGKSRRELRLREHHAYAGVANLELQPVIWAREIERQVGTARLERSHDRNNEIERAVEMHADQRIGGYAKPAQTSRHPVRPRVQFAVGKRPLFARKSNGVRMRSCNSLETRGESLARWENELHAVRIVLHHKYLATLIYIITAKSIR